MNLMDIKKSDSRFFKMAKKEAEKSSFPRFHVGCVVVYKGHVIASAHNLKKEAPIQKKYNHYRHFNNCSAGPVKHSLHAEIAALKSIPYPIAQQLDWKRVKIYIYRIAIGLPQRKGFARPCAACRQCIADMGIRDMYYTTDTGYAYERIDMDND